MKLVIFGLSISSSWGNGHATIWRGLCRALARRGHTIVFYERDVAYYADHRDQSDPEGVGLVLYPEWNAVRETIRRDLADADVAFVTSFCPDGPAAAREVLGSRVPLRVFYDLDTPITLELLAQDRLTYIGPEGLGGFDLVLSYTGGTALEELQRQLGARRTAALYGSVDPDVHRPADFRSAYAADLSYLGTYAADRQDALAELFLRPARRRPEAKFLIGGALYPPDFPWLPNLYFVRHVPPAEHAAFYCSSRFTLSVTRGAMARMGYCPSGRLFEAAAAGAPIVTDYWEGLETFFEPGRELLVADSADAVLALMDMPEADRRRIGWAGRARALASHTALHRAQELEHLLEGIGRSAVNAPAGIVRSA